MKIKMVSFTFFDLRPHSLPFWQALNLGNARWAVKKYPLNCSIASEVYPGLLSQDTQIRTHIPARTNEPLPVDIGNQTYLEFSPVRQRAD